MDIHGDLAWPRLFQWNPELHTEQVKAVSWLTMGRTLFSLISLKMGKNSIDNVKAYHCSNTLRREVGFQDWSAPTVLGANATQ